MKILKYFVFIYVFIIKITYIFNSTYEEVLTAFKEVAYSYYMRGRNIQYNDPRRGYFPPEEATQQKRNYSSNTTPAYNYNASNNRGSKVSNVRTNQTNQTYKRGNYSGAGNDGTIVKETRTKVQMGSRSQFRNSGNPTSSVTTEKRVYNSNTFFNK